VNGESSARLPEIRFWKSLSMPFGTLPGDWAVKKKIRLRAHSKKALQMLPTPCCKLFRRDLEQSFGFKSRDLARSHLGLHAGGGSMTVPRHLRPPLRRLRLRRIRTDHVHTTDRSRILVPLPAFRSSSNRISGSSDRSSSSCIQPQPPSMTGRYQLTPSPTIPQVVYRSMDSG
jgi:hypothetical protein